MSGPTAGARLQQRRLLLLTTELRPAGAERVVYEIATRLPPERWRVRVCSLRSPGGDPGAIARELRAAGIEVEALALAGPGDLPGALRLLRALRRFRPDVLHAHLFHANFAARLLGRPIARARILSTLHVVERRELPLRRWLERLSAPRDDLTVAVSQAVADHALQTGAALAARLRVVRNGIDLVRFAPPPQPAAARRAARRALDLPEDAFVLGAVARLDPQKGLGDLIAAFARLRHPETLLVLAGQGEEEGALRAQAKALDVAGRVRFLGLRPDIPRVLQALDLFCIPSHSEGFCLAAVEALAAGIPVVASAVDGLPEAVGDAGVLVPPADPAALAAALGRLIGSAEQRAALAARGPRQAARHDAGRMVADYARLYEDLLSGGLR